MTASRFARTASAFAAILVLVSLAPSRAPAADTTGISIKQVRPGGSDSSYSTRPAPKILTIGDASAPDVEPATRELIARARTLDNDAGNFRLEREITQEMTALLARGGPDAQRVVFDHWPLYKRRSRAMMIAALGTHFEKHPLDRTACAAAQDAIGDVVDAARDNAWQRGGGAPYHILARMGQRPELTDRVIRELRARGGNDQRVAALVKDLLVESGADAGGDPAARDRDADALRRLHQAAVDLAAADYTRTAAINTLGILDNEQAMKILAGIATGDDPAVDGAESAPLNGIRRTPADVENEAKRRVREQAISALTNRHVNVHRDPKSRAALEQQVIPTLGRVVTSTRQHAIRDAALNALIGQLGDAGRLAIVDLYEREADPPLARLLADRITRITPYPPSLLMGANHTTSSDGAVFRAAASKIMRLMVASGTASAPEVAHLAEDPASSAELRRQATITLLESPAMRQRVDDATMQRLLASPHPDVAAIAMRVAMRNGTHTRLFTPDMVRPMLTSPDVDQRRTAIHTIFCAYRRAQLTSDQVLPLLSSPYPDVAQAAARATLSDDALRKSVGIDTARRIGALMGVQTVDHIAKPNQARAVWLTQLPAAPATATPGGPTAATSSGGGGGSMTSIRWSATWWTAGVFVAAVGLVYLFAMLTVPEPHVAVARAGR